MRAQGQLAGELAAAKEEYQRLVAAEVTRVRQSYLEELQEHLLLQRKVGVSDEDCHSSLGPA